MLRRTTGVNQAQRRSEQGSSRREKAELLLYFSPFAVESMFAFIDNVAERRKKKTEKITHPSRLRVKRRGDSLSLRRNGFTTEFTEVGTLRVGRVGGTSVG
jgi:hypothetical protein